MAGEKNFYQVVEEICARDSRYKADSYEFVMDALHFTQRTLNRKGHVSGKELLSGIRECALKQYGPMARTVLAYWGITRTEDFGNIVFNMIAEKLFSKTDSDSLADFKDVYDFEQALRHEVKDIAL